MRVTDMRGVDLSRWRFDWDLTFSAIIAHPDGTILHRYGGRDHRGADHWLNDVSLKAFLQAGLQSYADYQGPAPKLAAPRSLDQVPAFAKRDKGACIHCHSVNPALRLEKQAADRWSLADLWTHPSPARLGVDLHPERQTEIIAIEPDSVAMRAGLRVGDQLVSVAGQRLATASDLMAALDELPGGATRTVLHLLRPNQKGEGEAASGPPRPLQLDFPAGWKVDPPAEFAWRPSKWGLSPAPGFGGPVLDATQLRKLGLAEDTFAFRVNYLVTWGENQRWGRAAAKAGVRDGQVILGAGDMRAFDSIDHFHAWWRLTRQPGELVELVLWEDGKERRLELPVLRTQ